MNDRPLLFAFLADRLSSARIDIAHDYRDVIFTSDRTGTVLMDGVDTPFRIVTEPEQLRGLELSGFAFVRSARGTMGWHKWQDMELIAGTRVRQCAANDSVNTDRK